MSARELRCPSCDGPMGQVERRAVLIDLCRDCKGVFLDRGELDKLLDQAEADLAPTERFGRERRSGHDDDDDDDRRSRERSSGGGRRKKRGGFLGEILDFG